MIETQSYIEALPENVLQKYSFFETGNAARIAQVTNPEAFDDIIDVLTKFQLTDQLLLTKGGSRGPIPRLIDDAFESRGWMEARVDTFRRAYMFKGQHAPTVEDDPLGVRANENCVSTVYQEGYSVDNVKARLALDVEWNPKDGNLDRDFSAYRAWHTEGLIDASFLVTRMHADTRDITNQAWSDWVERNPKDKKIQQPVDYRTTTTANYEKALDRVKRGDLGACPILVIGIGRAAWDGVDWDGRTAKYFKDEGVLRLVQEYGDTTKESFEYELVQL